MSSSAIRINHIETCPGQVRDQIPCFTYHIVMAFFFPSVISKCLFIMQPPVYRAAAYLVIHICFTTNERTAESGTLVSEHHGFLARIVTSNKWWDTSHFFSEPIHSKLWVIPRAKHLSLQAAEDSRALFNCTLPPLCNKQNSNHFLVIISHLGKTISNAQWQIYNLWGGRWGEKQGGIYVSQKFLSQYHPQKRQSAMVQSRWSATSALTGFRELPPNRNLLQVNHLLHLNM